MIQKNSFTTPELADATASGQRTKRRAASRSGRASRRIVCHDGSRNTPAFPKGGEPADTSRELIDAGFSSLASALWGRFQVFRYSKSIEVGYEAIASRLEAISSTLEPSAGRLEAIDSRLDAIASRLDAIASRLEAIAGRMEAIARRPLTY